MQQSALGWQGSCGRSGRDGRCQSLPWRLSSAPAKTWWRTVPPSGAPQQWLNRRPLWTPGPTSSPVQNREPVTAAPGPVGQEAGICDSVVTICWGEGRERKREQRRRCTSWWGCGAVAGGWAAGTPASGLGRCGGWGHKGQGIIAGSGHLVVAGGLDTSEALSLPQLQGWASEEWEAWGWGQCWPSTTLGAALRWPCAPHPRPRCSASVGS